MDQSVNGLSLHCTKQVRPYNEKLLEEFIRDFPQAFLDESLQLVKQQPTIDGFRPDLIFRDAEGRLVIVEVQLGALDRAHLYRTLEYRDLLMQATQCEEPRIILFCNDLRPKHKQLLVTHRLVCIAVSKEEFLAKARSLLPTLEVTEGTVENTEPALTAKKVLKALRAPALADESRSEPDARVFWFVPGFPHVWHHDKPDIWQHLPLPDLTAAPPLFFDRSHQFDSQLPAEVIVGCQTLETLKFEQLWLIRDWLELLGDSHDHEGGEAELVLGYRGCTPNPVCGLFDFTSDIVYGYEQYIQGRIRRFQPIWNRYGRDRGYNVAQLRSDLSLLQSFTFYAGKYPDLTPVPACREFDIKFGPGRLASSIERRRSVLQHWVSRGMFGYSAETLVEFDRLVREDHDEWVTVRFKGLRDAILQSLQVLIQSLLNARIGPETSDVPQLLSRIGLQPSRKLKDIAPEALELSRRYCVHLSPTPDNSVRSS